MPWRVLPYSCSNEQLIFQFCDTIVKWQKKTRIIEHLNTKMHAERKELKMQRFLAEMQSQVIILFAMRLIYTRVESLLYFALIASFDLS